MLFTHFYTFLSTFGHVDYFGRGSLIFNKDTCTDILTPYTRYKLSLIFVEKSKVLRAAINIMLRLFFIHKARQNVDFRQILKHFQTF